MKKKVTVFSVFLLILVILCPIRANAMTISDGINNFTKNIYVLEDGNLRDRGYSDSTSGVGADGATDGRTHVDEDIYDTDDQECNGDGLLGDPTREDTVAWLLQLIFNVIKVVGPILVVILSSIDFLKVIVKSDDEAMSKAQKKLIIRMILALLLFLIPTIVQVILQVFGIYGDPTCNIK